MHPHRVCLLDQATSYFPLRPRARCRARSERCGEPQRPMRPNREENRRPAPSTLPPPRCRADDDDIMRPLLYRNTFTIAAPPRRLSSGHVAPFTILIIYCDTLGIVRSIWSRSSMKGLPAMLVSSYVVGGASGMKTVKTVPSPGVLATSIRPLRRSTIFLTIASPSPLPPV